MRATALDQQQESQMQRGKRKEKGKTKRSVKRLNQTMQKFPHLPCRRQLQTLRESSTRTTWQKTLNTTSCRAPRAGFGNTQNCTPPCPGRSSATFRNNSSLTRTAATRCASNGCPSFLREIWQKTTTFLQNR